MFIDLDNVLAEGVREGHKLVSKLGENRPSL